MIRDVQHDPYAVHYLVASIRVEQARHVAILAWEAELPLVKLAVQLTILLLPLLDVRQGANVDRLLQEAMYLRKNADDFDVVAERA